MLGPGTLSKGLRSTGANSPTENDPEGENEFLKTSVLRMAVSETAGRECDGLSLENIQRTFRFRTDVSISFRTLTITSPNYCHNWS